MGPRRSQHDGGSEDNNNESPKNGEIELCDLIRALANFEKNQDLLEKSGEQEAQLDQIHQPTAEALAESVLELCKHKDLQAAELQLLRFGDTGVQPVDDLVNALVGALVDEGDVVRAAEVTKRHIHLWTPENALSLRLILGLADLDKHDEVIDLLALLHDHKAEGLFRVLGALSSYYVDRDRVKQAADVVLNFIPLKLKPAPRQVSYLLSALQQHLLVPEAVAIVAGLHSIGTVPFFCFDLSTSHTHTLYARLPILYAFTSIGATPRLRNLVSLTSHVLSLGNCHLAVALLASAGANCVTQVFYEALLARLSRSHPACRWVYMHLHANPTIRWQRTACFEHYFSHMRPRPGLQP